MARNLTRRTLLASTGIAGAAAATTLAGAPAAAAKSPRKLAGPAARRLELYGLLGNLPSRRRPISGKKRSETERDGYILETWDLDLNGIENVPAYLARPKVSHGRAPEFSSTTRTAGVTRSGRRSSSTVAATCSPCRTPRS